MSDKQFSLDSVLKLVQCLAVVGGVVVSVYTFKLSIDQDINAREKDAQARIINACEPFVKLRHQQYMETIKMVGIISTPLVHIKEEREVAEKRFWELYWAELSMVQDKNVKIAMKKFAETINKDRAQKPSPEQQAANDLAQALQVSFSGSS